MDRASVVEAYIKEFLDRANKKLGRRFQKPRISFKLKGRVAGRAFYRQWLIKINLAIFNIGGLEEVRITVGHEVAHLITHAIFDHKKRIKPHGYEWKTTMELLGLKPERCHNMDLPMARQRIRHRFHYICTGCEKGYDLSQIRHNKVRYRGVVYCCRYCGQKLLFSPEYREQKGE